jgi:hypothetical protein
MLQGISNRGTHLDGNEISDCTLLAEYDYFYFKIVFRRCNKASEKDD